MIKTSALTLYRWIFYWDSLSADEKKTAASYFQNDAEGKKLLPGLKLILGTHGILNEEARYLNVFSPADANKIFNNIDEKMKYFGEDFISVDGQVTYLNENSEIRSSFYKFIQFFMLIYLTEFPKAKNRHSIFAELGMAVYNLLILFRQDIIPQYNPVAIVSELDTYCLKHNQSLCEVIETLRLFQITPFMGEKTDVAWWSKAALSEGLPKIQRGFLLAGEIHGLLDGAPQSIIQAESTALNCRKYRRHTEYPALADFCIKAFVPEAWFSALLAFKKDRVATLEFGWLCQWMISKPEDVFVEFMRLCKQDLYIFYKDIPLMVIGNKHPLIYYTMLYHELLIDTRSYFPAFYLHYIISRGNWELFPAFCRFINLDALQNIETREDFEALVSALSKKLLMPTYSPEFVNWFLAAFSVFMYDPNSLDDLEKFNHMILDIFILPKLVGLELKDEWLNDPATSTMIQRLSSSLNLIVLQISKLPNLAVKYAYLNKVIGKAHLIDHVKCPTDLNSLLSDNDKPYNLKIAELLGADVLKSILPYGTDGGLLKQFIARLPEASEVDWFNKLMPEAEIKAKLMVEGVIRKASNTDFSVGFFGVGGGRSVTINKVPKSVPEHVAKMCDVTALANKGEISYQEASVKIEAHRKLALAPLNVGMFRSATTQDFYNNMYEASNKAS